MTAPSDPRRMVGDPLISADHARSIDRDAQHAACLYGAAMMRNVGRLPDDLDAVDVHFEPPATLVFISADRRQVELGRFVIPGRVLSYRPRAIALPPAGVE